MARVFIPPALQALTAGQQVIQIEGTTVREVIDRLESAYPGIKTHLCRDNQLRSGWMIAVDSAFATSGLREPLRIDSEVHFLPAIGGGA